MPGSISIQGLRNIETLNFDMPGEGVWLLSGLNGAGKSTLLACIRRIGSANAFPIHFPSSLQSDALDNFSAARIIFRIEGEEVEYAYRGERWTPRPRRNSKLLNRFGYQSVIYVGATADRITPRPEDFRPRRVRYASNQIIAAANRVFETEKFNELRTVNLARGVGNQAFVLRVSPPPHSQFHSEKQFSTGELCILKLIRALHECPDRSLVLIDELELALHARVQIQLFHYLVEIANQKHLTVLFSTHSVSLLKSVPRKYLIFLQRDQNTVTAITGCFPTYAIGNISLGEERAPDRAIYVEDDVATYIVEALVKLSLQNNFANQPYLFPSVKVVPIGGFENVVRFLDRHDELFPLQTQPYALLDADVKDETVRIWRENENHQRLAWFQRLEDRIKYLPWTPEVGLINYLRLNRGQVENELRNRFADRQIVLDQQILNNVPNEVGRQQRARCKTIFGNVCDVTCRVTGRSPEDIERAFCEIFAKTYFENNRAAILELLNPMLR